MTGKDDPNIPAVRPEGRESPAERAEAYAVGYGRPPREHRFAPGRSGNPRGRPKGPAAWRLWSPRPSGNGSW
jgi:Family of unknown function (DUF5681)